MAGKDLEKFIEKYPTYIEALEMLEQKAQRIAELERELAESEKRFVVANNLRKKSDEVLLNYKTEKYGLDKTIQELRKIKLSMPEKEWYYKGFENCERQISSHIADLTLENKQLKQQLEEKDKLLKCYQDEERQIAKILGDKDLTIIGSRVHLENLIVELKNKIRDRDLIIEEKNKQVEDWKQKTQTFLNRVSEQNYEIANNNQKQLAIQELEKVKQTLHKCYYEQVGKYYYAELGNIEKVIDNQIKKLKGEEYGIESVEKLKKKLGYYIDKIDLEAENDYLKKAIEKQNVVTQSISKDRDTWKRACELACDVLRDINYKIHNEDRIDFENIFYQEAKMDGERK